MVKSHSPATSAKAERRGEINTRRTLGSHCFSEPANQSSADVVAALGEHRKSWNLVDETVDTLLAAGLLQVVE